MKQRYKLFLNGKCIQTIEANSLMDALQKVGIEDYEESYGNFGGRYEKYLILTDYDLKYSKCISDTLELFKE